MLKWSARHTNRLAYSTMSTLSSTTRVRITLARSRGVSKWSGVASNYATPYSRRSFAAFIHPCVAKIVNVWLRSCVCWPARRVLKQEHTELDQSGWALTRFVFASASFLMSTPWYCTAPSTSFILRNTSLTVDRSSIPLHSSIFKLWAAFTIASVAPTVFTSSSFRVWQRTDTGCSKSWKVARPSINSESCQHLT